MKNKENRAFQAVLRLFGPLLFYELCAEAAAWVCSLFGTTNALFVTGAGAFFALPFLYAVYRRQNRKYCASPFAGCVSSAFMGVGFCLSLNVVLQVLIPSSGGWNHVREAVYGSSFLLRFLVTAVLAPVTEELLFRGLIRTELKEYMKPRAAALLGALLFGLYHGNLSQGIYAFLLALCLELVCEWSGCLLPAVFLHAGANGAAVCFTALMSGMPEAAQRQFVLGAAVAGAVLTAAALYKTKEVFCQS